MKPPATPHAWPQPDELPELIGDNDVYLFDQTLKGRITSHMRVLDAGCGSGRNPKYLLRCGLEVFGIDESAELVREVRALAARLAKRAGFGTGAIVSTCFPMARNAFWSMKRC